MPAGASAIPGRCVVVDSNVVLTWCFFFFSSRRRHTRLQGDWSSDVCSSDLGVATQLRRDAIRHLTESADLRYVGGGGVVRYSRFLREVADAKICINLPGNEIGRAACRERV